MIIWTWFGLWQIDTALGSMHFSSSLLHVSYWWSRQLTAVGSPPLAWAGWLPNGYCHISLLTISALIWLTCTVAVEGRGCELWLRETESPVLSASRVDMVPPCPTGPQTQNTCIAVFVSKKGCSREKCCSPPNPDAGWCNLISGCE